MNILEVKYGSWPLAADAEAQLENYVARGPQHVDELSATWLKRGHAGIKLSSVRAMSTSSINLSAPLQIPGVDVPVDAAWCRDGVIVCGLGRRDPRRAGNSTATRTRCASARCARSPRS